MSKTQIKESQVLIDLWNHREKFYKETKHLSSKELLEKINQDAEAIMKKHDLKLPKTEIQR